MSDPELESLFQRIADKAMHGSTALTYAYHKARQEERDKLNRLAKISAQRRKHRRRCARYYKLHRARLIEKMRLRRLNEDKVKRRKYFRKWYQANREVALARYKRYYQDHREEIIAKRHEEYHAKKSLTLSNVDAIK